MKNRNYKRILTYKKHFAVVASIFLLLGLPLLAPTTALASTITISNPTTGVSSGFDDVWNTLSTLPTDNCAGDIFLGHVGDVSTNLTGSAGACSGALGFFYFSDGLQGIKKAIDNGVFTPYTGTSFFWWWRAEDTTVNNSFTAQFYYNSSTSNYSLVNENTNITTLQTLPVPLTCSSFDIACYIKQALAWAFVPTDASLSQFSNIISFSNPGASVLAYKFPFSYGFDIVNIYNEMFPSSGSSLNFTVHTTMGDFTLLSSSVIASYSWYSLIYGAMSALMYLGTAMFLYKQVFGIHDQTHKTV